MSKKRDFEQLYWYITNIELNQDIKSNVDSILLKLEEIYNKIEDY